jgi:thioredoxin 1
MALKLTKDNFETEVLKSDKPVLVDFYADWCMPCKMLGPVIEEIAKEVTTGKVGKVNIDNDPELASKYSVVSIPTLILFKDGKAEKTLVGVRSKQELLNLFK